MRWNREENGGDRQIACLSVDNRLEDRDIDLGRHLYRVDHTSWWQEVWYDAGKILLGIERSVVRIIGLASFRTI